MKTAIICLFGILLCTAETCEKTEVSKAIEALPPESCGADKKTVKTVSGVEGSIGFEPTLQQYFIRRSIPGTFDSQDIGLLCGTIPQNLTKIDAKVSFSGTYKSYDKPSPATIGGQTYYYLDLSKVELQGGK
jgi:hypothetical protein